MSKRGPVDDIQIIDSSANDTVISFDKKFDVYGWKVNSTIVYNVMLPPFSTNIKLKLTNICTDCQIYMDNVQITNSLTSISLPVGSFTKRLVANTGCGNTAEVHIVFNRPGPISCISVGDNVEEKRRINDQLLLSPTIHFMTLLVSISPPEITAL